MKDLAVYTSSKILPSIFNFVAMALLSRILGPTEYGHLALLTAAASFLSTLILQWPSLYLFRFYSTIETNRAGFVSTLLRHQITTGFACLAIASTVGIYLKEPIWWIGLVLLGTTQAFFEFTLRLHNVELKKVEFLKLNILRSSSYLMFSPMLLLIFGANYAFVAGANIVIYFASSLSSISKKYLCIFNHQQQPLPRVINYVFPLMLASGLTIILDAIDRYFINYFHGSSLTGIYSANYEILQYSLQSIFGIILLICGPLVFNSYEKKDFESLNHHLLRIQKFFFALMFPLAIFMTIFSSEVVRLTSGPAFLLVDNTITAFLVFGIFLSGIKMYFFDQILLMTKNTRAILIINILGLTLNLILNYFLIPKFAILGAALATAASFLSIFVLSAVISRKYYKWPLALKENSVFIVFFSTMGLAAYLYYINTPQSWILTASLFLLSWAAVLYTMNWENIRSAVEKLRR